MVFIFYRVLRMDKTEELKKLIDENPIMDASIHKPPDCVIETLFNEAKRLEAEISYHEQMVHKLSAAYQAHVNYMLSFGAGNLSHSSSDNIGTRPQAQA